MEHLNDEKILELKKVANNPRSKILNRVHLKFTTGREGVYLK